MRVTVRKSSKAVGMGMGMGCDLFFGHYPTIEQAIYLVSGLHDKIHIMRDKHISKVQLIQNLYQSFGCLRIQPCNGLIQKENLGIV